MSTVRVVGIFFLFFFLEGGAGGGGGEGGVVVNDDVTLEVGSPSVFCKAKIKLLKALNTVNQQCASFCMQVKLNYFSLYFNDP